MLPVALRRRFWRIRGTQAAVKAAWVQEPAAATRFSQLPLLACDAEMSGLDAARAEILSLAWVPIDGGELSLAGAREVRIRNRDTVGESATVHGLRDCDLAPAGTLEAALQDLLAAAAGRVLVLHHALLDLAFLDRGGRELFGTPLLLPAIDTLRLAARRLERAGTMPGEGDLTLAACRRRHGLPDHHAHSALGDAIATAELLLAQVAEMEGDPRYRDLR